MVLRYAALYYQAGRRRDELCRRRDGLRAPRLAALSALSALFPREATQLPSAVDVCAALLAGREAMLEGDAGSIVKHSKAQ